MEVYFGAPTTIIIIIIKPTTITVTNSGNYIILTKANVTSALASGSNVQKVSLSRHGAKVAV